MTKEEQIVQDAAKIPACVDCKFCDIVKANNGSGFLHTYHTCHHPSSFNYKDLETGEMIYNRAMYNRDTNHRRRCGHSGRFFERRD